VLAAHSLASVCSAIAYFNFSMAVIIMFCAVCSTAYDASTFFFFLFFPPPVAETRMNSIDVGSNVQAVVITIDYIQVR